MAKDVEVQSTTNPARKRMVSASDAKVLVRLGRWQYPTTAVEAGPPAPTGPAFASQAAEDAARELKLGAEAFAGRTGSGKDGAFTKADVLAIAEEAAAPADPDPETPADPDTPTEPTE